MAELTTIPVSKATRDKLKRFGAKGDTYEEILTWMMEKVEYEEFMERQYRRLTEKEKFVSLDEL